MFDMSRPRIRSLKPEAWQDERIGALSRDARLLFVGLITMADDEGRLRAQPAMIIGHVYPWDEITLKQLAAWLAEIEAQCLVERYEIDGRPYIAFRNWKRHQRINRPTASELPPPSGEVAAANSAGDSLNDHGDTSGISSAAFTPSRARGSDQEGIGADQPLAATPQRSRAVESSRSQAETVECPRCGVPAGEKCDGVRGKRESCHLERHHAVGELQHVTGKAKPSAPRHGYQGPSSEIVALRDEHFPEFEVSAVEGAATTLRFRREDVTVAGVRQVLLGTEAA